MLGGVDPFYQCEIGRKLTLLANMKSHTDFRLVSNSVVLNHNERRNDDRRVLSLL